MTKNVTTLIDDLYLDPSGNIHPALSNPGFTLPQKQSLVVYNLNDPRQSNAIQKRHSIKTESLSDSRNNIVAVFEHLRAPRLEISCAGSGNICVLGPNANVEGKMNFSQNDCRIVISGHWKTRTIRLNVTLLQNEQRFFFGSGGSAEGASASVRGKKSAVIIGDDCMLSWQVGFRPSDMHAIVDITSNSIINKAQDIIIHPHVWIGQSSLVLKGATINAGTIIGAKSLIPGNRTYDGMSIYAGNPARKIRANVTWDRDSESSSALRNRIEAVCKLYGGYDDNESTCDHIKEETIAEKMDGTILNSVEKKARKLFRDPVKFLIDSRFNLLKPIQTLFLTKKNRRRIRKRQ